MDIGIPKEIKTQEGRVALMPIHVSTLTSKGHRVVVEQSAGLASGATDQAYTDAGAEIVVLQKRSLQTRKWSPK